MVRLLAVRLFVAIWKRAISISEKLSPRAWRLLTVIECLLLVLSIWGFQDSRQPKEQAAKPRVSKDTEGTRLYAFNASQLKRQIFKDTSLGNYVPSRSTVSPQITWEAPGESNTTEIALLNSATAHDLKSLHLTRADADQQLDVALERARALSYLAQEAEQKANTDPKLIAAMFADIQQTYSECGTGAAFNDCDCAQLPALTAINQRPIGSSFRFVVDAVKGQSWGGMTGPSSVNATDQSLSFLPSASSGFVGMNVSQFGSWPDSVLDFRHVVIPLPGVTFQSSPPESSDYKKELVFWISLFGMMVTPLSIISTGVIAWISLNRERAESIRRQAEFEEARRTQYLVHERMQRENELLRLQIEKLQLELRPQSKIIPAAL